MSAAQSVVESGGRTSADAFDNLEAYIPGDRRRALAAGIAMPDRVRGAALFADISGFTALTETLANELGPQRGAEELTANLNRVFHALIDEVERFGGHVIYFSGDAITCWLDGDDGARATACALAMQTDDERARRGRHAGGREGAARDEGRRRGRARAAVPRRRPGHPADRRARRAADRRARHRRASRREQARWCSIGRRSNRWATGSRSASCAIDAESGREFGVRRER